MSQRAATKVRSGPVVVIDDREAVPLGYRRVRDRDELKCCDGTMRLLCCSHSRNHVVNASGLPASHEGSVSERLRVFA